MILLCFVLAALIVTWLRLWYYRTRYDRAMTIMSRGDTAQRASARFWRIVGLILLIVVIRLYLEVHFR